MFESQKLMVIVPTDTSIRDRDSDSEDWEEKEASRTHSVKFTDDVSEAKEVSIWCCNSNKVGGWFTNKSRPVLSRSFTTHAYKTMRYDQPKCFHNVAVTIRSKCGDLRSWFQRNVSQRCTRHRAYVAISSLLVALE